MLVEPPKSVTPMTNLSLVQQLTTVLSSLLTEERGITEPTVIEGAFVLALTWSLGGALTQPGRVQFDKFLKKLAGLPTSGGESCQCGQLPSSLPTLHDYTFDLDQRQWRPWTAEVPDYVPPADGKFASIVVPTSDTVRSTWVLNQVASVRGAVLFVGESGTAKTTVISKYRQIPPLISYILYLISCILYLVFS